MVRAALSGACALVLLVGMVPAVAASGAVSATAEMVPVSAAGTGGVAINGTSTATADPQVTVTIPAPVASLGMLRVSNDGGATAAEVAWTTSLSWSLIDPAAGGVDADGTKTVTIEAGDGLGTWTPLGSASILLDRTGPVVTLASMDFRDAPGGSYLLEATDAGVGVARTEISLDGVHWRVSDPSPWNFLPDGTFDVRERMIGGTYGLGPRVFHSRIVDKLGNVTIVPDRTITVTSDRWSSEPPVDFATPLPAITGHDFTIAPVFNEAYRVAAGAKCRWSLVWGDEHVRLEAERDETYGEVRTTVLPVNGMCQPWTFTLPYTPVLEYSWTLAIIEADSSTSYWTQPFVGAFRAAKDSTYRGIATSNLPLYAVVPDRDYVGLDGTVTYRLYARGGAPARSGWWGCIPADGSPNSAQQTQTGGSSFVCHVTTAEAWAADWGWWSADDTWRFYAGYDPVGDRSRPVMRSIRATVEPGSAVGTSEVARVSWRATDTGTGVRRYTVQVSRNGGAWATLTLPAANATSVTRSLALGASYRFRARATDRAGNTGAWKYSPTIRPKRYDDRSTAVKWSSGWTVSGPVHTTAAAARTVSLSFSGQAVGILAPKGPGFGWAQVYVDGTLAGTVNLNWATGQTAKVVWQRSFGAVGTHTVRVRTLGTVGHPGVAIDGFAVFR